MSDESTAAGSVAQTAPPPPSIPPVPLVAPRPVPWNGEEAVFPSTMPPAPATARIWALDAAIARLDGTPSWGWRPVVVPLVTFVVVITAGQVISHLVHPVTSDGRLWASAALNLGAQLVMAVGVWWGGRRVAAVTGGWATFGWARPRWIDLGMAAAGFGVALGGRYVISIVLGIASHGAAIRQSQNLHIDHVSWPSAIILLVATAVAAPVLEELTFRGLLLRTFMRRLYFAPAAALSTLVFALFHTYEVSTVLGAVTLALIVGVLGIINCVLVRYTNRLTAGMGAHAALNGVSVGVLLLLAAR